MGAGRKEIVKQTVTYIAGGTIVADRFVSLDSSGDIVQSGDGVEIKGVAREAGATGASIEVAIINAGNIVKVAAAAAITTGALVASDANGRVKTSASNDLEVGQADEGAGALDDFAIIQLTRGGVTA